MKYWIVSDTHFGHEKLKQWTGRGDDWDDRILQELPTLVDTDIFIHLGDICWGDDAYWHECMLPMIDAKKKILVRGNHDIKSTSWYYDHGWDLVVDRFDLKVYGVRIAFTHIPLDTQEDGIDINIHGHIHNCTHHDDEYGYVEGFHKVVHLEEDPSPQLLDKIIGDRSIYG